jgi:hypothetical protein
MKPRTPKAVKAWMNKVDEAERAYIAQMKIKDPRPGMWVYRRISTGLIWDGEKLEISKCAQRELRDKEYLFDEFPEGYNYQKN